MGRRTAKVVIIAKTTENTGTIMKFNGPPMSPYKIIPITTNAQYKIIGVAVNTTKQITDAKM